MTVFVRMCVCVRVLFKLSLSTHHNTAPSSNQRSPTGSKRMFSFARFSSNSAGALQIGTLVGAITCLGSMLTVAAISFDLYGQVENYFNWDVARHCQVEGEGRAGGAVPGGKRRLRGFEDVIGCERIKECLQRHLYALFSSQAELPSRGFIFAGAPGQGKTFMAAALAAEMQKYNAASKAAEPVRFVTLQLEQVWDDSAVVRTIEFAIKRYAPCVLFIDELHRVPASVQTFLLTHLDGIDSKATEGAEQRDAKELGLSPKPWLLLACTTEDHLLSPALTRSGRLDNKVIFYPPTEEDRVISFRRQIGTLTEAQARDVARQIAGYSHADIASICKDAKLRALSREPKGMKQVEVVDLDASVHQFMIELTNVERQFSDSDRERVAIHEIGHCFAAFVASGVRCPVRVQSTGDHKLAGYNLLNVEESKAASSGDAEGTGSGPATSSLVTRTDLINQIGVLLGGTVAEQVFCGSRSSGCANDLLRVEACLDAMADAGLLLDGLDAQPSFVLAADRRRAVGHEIVTQLQQALTNLFRKHADTFRLLVRLLRDNEYLTSALIRETLVPRDIKEGSLSLLG
jgi:cell division protease FtsH